MIEIAKMKSDEILEYLRNERGLIKIVLDEDQYKKNTADEDPWVCEECGSHEVEESKNVWVLVNTGEVISSSDDDSNLWCPDCQNNTRIISKSEYDDMNDDNEE
jgi:hypothetical protein